MQYTNYDIHTQSAYEQVAWVIVCNSIKIAKLTARTKSSKTCIYTVQMHEEYSIVAKHTTWCSILVQFNNFDWAMGFGWSYMLLLKPFVLMRS